MQPVNQVEQQVAEDKLFSDLFDHVVQVIIAFAKQEKDFLSEDYTKAYGDYLDFAIQEFNEFARNFGINLADRTATDPYYNVMSNIWEACAPHRQVFRQFFYECYRQYFIASRGHKGDSAEYQKLYNFSHASIIEKCENADFVAAFKQYVMSVSRNNRNNLLRPFPQELIDASLFAFGLKSVTKSAVNRLI